MLRVPPQTSTIRIGATDAALGPQIDYNVPFFSLVPMVDPSDLVFGGWGHASFPAQIPQGC